MRSECFVLGDGSRTLSVLKTKKLSGGRLRDAAKAKLQEQTNDLGRGENRIKANEIFVTSKFFGQRGEKKFKFSLCLEDPKT